MGVWGEVSSSIDRWCGSGKDPKLKLFERSSQRDGLQYLRYVKLFKTVRSTASFLQIGQTPRSFLGGRSEGLCTGRIARMTPRLRSKHHSQLLSDKEGRVMGFTTMGFVLG